MRLKIINFIYPKRMDFRSKAEKRAAGLYTGYMRTASDAGNKVESVFAKGIFLLIIMSLSIGALYANGDAAETEKLALRAVPPAAVSQPANTQAEEINNSPGADDSSDKPSSSAGDQSTAALPPIIDKDTQPEKTVEEQYDPKQLFGKTGLEEDQAFQNVARNAMPMTPAQIIRLKQMLAVTQRASAATGEEPPKPTLGTQVVNLSPGALPPVIRLQQGFVTSVVFVDDTGADWPIAAYDLGNSRAFDIQWQQGSNVLMVQAINMYTYGNLAVKLKGLSTPVMLTLVPGQKNVDYRIDLRVQKRGPNAKLVLNGQEGETSPSSVLLNVLDGIAPRGSVVLYIKGDNDSQAWLSGNRLYLRTPLTILSPGWIAKMTSSDGTNAYEMVRTPSILVSKYGKPAEVRLEGL